MNSNIRSQVSGGDQYDTVYPAGSHQDFSQGTRDVSKGCYYDYNEQKLILSYFFCAADYQ